MVGGEPPEVTGSSSGGEVAKLPVVRVAVLAGGQQVDVAMAHPGHRPEHTDMSHISHVTCRDGAPRTPS